MNFVLALTSYFSFTACSSRWDLSDKDWNHGPLDLGSNNSTQHGFSAGTYFVFFVHCLWVEMDLADECVLFVSARPPDLQPHWGRVHDVRGELVHHSALHHRVLEQEDAASVAGVR